MTGKKKKSGECKHVFVKYPPRIGKLRVCKKCGFLWVLGDVKFGEHSIKLSGSGSYIEKSTVTAPASPVAGKVRVYATSGTSLRMKDSTGTETDLAAPGGDLYNFLTNPGFEIWQRGAGPFTVDGYTADRWFIGIGAGSSCTITRESTTKRDDSKYSVKGVYTHSTDSSLQHYVEGDGNLTPERLRGRQLTLAMLVHANAANAVRVAIYDGTTFTYSSYHAGDSAWATLSVTATIPTTATAVRAFIILNATATFFADNGTLVIGSTAQTYYPLHPAEEWERCQRYYEKHGGENASTWGELFYSATNTTYAHQKPFNTRKAVVPTMTRVGTWNTIAGTETLNFTYVGVSTYSLETTTGSATGGRYGVYGNATTMYITAEANP